MKKVFFLVALMCASVMSYAAPSAAAPTPTVPADQVMSIFSDAYTAKASWGFLEAWGQSTTLKNQAVSGDNYLLYENFNYLGWQTGEPYNAINMEKLHIDIWADAAGKVSIYPIYGGAGLTTDDKKSKSLTLEAGKWNSFDLDLASDFAGLDFSSIFQFKFADGDITSFAVDNVYFYRTTPLVDTEAPKNLKAAFESASYFSVKLKVSATDNSGAVSYVVKNGDNEVGNAGGKSGADVIVTISKLNPNTNYSFSVIAKDEKGNATSPVNVAAKTIAAPAAAAAPTYPQSRVLALYSDIYENLSFGIQDWWAMPAISEGPLSATSKALCIEPNTTGSSCFGLAFAKTDVTKYEVLEMDVYPTVENSVLKIQVIGIGEATSYNLVAKQWNHISLDIKDNTKTDCEQVGFYDCDKLLGDCFVQNILFMSTKVTAIDNAEAEVKAVKTIENGQLVIIKNGVRYNAAGQAVK